MTHQFFAAAFRGVSLGATLPGKRFASRCVLASAVLLGGCQTSGTDILSSVLPGSGQAKNEQQGDQIASVAPGENPNANTRLKNTRNDLTDYCPAVRIRSGTETFRTWPKNADKENLDNIMQQATITTVARECIYVGNQLRIKVGARGRVITGPKGQTGPITMPIRVAVTVGGETAYSKLHRPVQTIAEGASGATFEFVDNEVNIPAPTATNVRVYLGFDEGPYNTP